MGADPRATPDCAWAVAVSSVAGDRSMVARRHIDGVGPRVTSTVGCRRRSVARRVQGSSLTRRTDARRERVSAARALGISRRGSAHDRAAPPPRSHPRARPDRRGRAAGSCRSDGWYETGRRSAGTAPGFERGRMRDRGQICASCTELEASIPHPVVRAAIASPWSPKIDSACVARPLRAAT